ncbi:MAG TPA: nicotinamide riboside transporter PnuC [Bacteroidales bacterium]|nr:nicotinamide riboside transporter PnuC [Bacteroidales bacterium]
MDSVYVWIIQNWIEISAATLGLVGIFLQIRQSHWYWLTSIIMVSLFIVVFYNSRFYADMSFQFYYLTVSIYGWYYWIIGKNQGSNEVKKTYRLKPVHWLYSIGVSIVFFVLIILILKNFTDSDVAFGDAFTTALSFVATWLLARKIIENWLFWIVIDAVSAGLYIYKALYPTAVLFVVLTVLAIVGYFKWKKFLVND